MGEESFMLIQIYHIHGSGEIMTFKCSRCGRDIYMYLKSLELDPGAVEVYWDKSPNYIEMKRRKLKRN
jgi:hypothetical protein